MATFIIDEIGGAFPNWANMRDADGLASVGYPYPTLEKANQYRKLLLEKQAKWHGEQHTCIDINKQMKNEAPPLSELIVFLVAQGLMSSQTCSSWAKQSKQMIKVLRLSDLQEQIEVEPNLTSSERNQNLGKEKRKLQDNLLEYGYSQETSGETHIVLQHESDSHPTKKARPEECLGVAKRVRFSESLNDSGVSLNNTSRSPPSAVGQEESKVIGQVNMMWESELKAWMADKVWMEKSKVLQIQKSLSSLNDFIQKAAGWDRALAEMDDEVRLTVNSLLKGQELGFQN